MALTWPDEATRTLPRIAPFSPTVRPAAPARATASPALVRVRAIASSPTTALVVLLLGLALLFALPAVGLPFVALVVLPAVVHHLRAEQRSRFRRSAR